MKELQLIAPWLCNIHVFNWTAQKERRPLSESKKRWKEYFRLIEEIPGDRYALIEFVMNDSTIQLIEDAITLSFLLELLYYKGYSGYINR